MCRVAICVGKRDRGILALRPDLNWGYVMEPEILREINDIEERIARIKRVLHGFNVSEEREQVIRLLKSSLPDGYRCGKKNCDGVLLYRGFSSVLGTYRCSDCGNLRKTIRNVKRDG